MDLIKQHNEKYRFFAEITGEAMRVYNKFHAGLLESAYEAALKYLLELRGMKVERQVYLPIFWDDVQLEQSYRMDLVVEGNIIVELKSVKFVGDEHRRQLWNYMRITHQPYGMLLNFGGNKGLFSEWYRLYDDGQIERVKLF
jgi:GxxExxY protein